MQIDFATDPQRYRHWRLACDGPVATLTLDVNPAGGLFPGTELKLNSYDLGVDIELADAVQRLRFEHPEVKVVVLRSGKDRVFCAGANIRMLVDDGSSTVSLPEVPLLAVLPGTGGLTRVTDKRKVRRDHADVFCTTEEGIKGKRAVDWRLVDEVVPGSKLEDTVTARAKEFAG